MLMGIWVVHVLDIKKILVEPSYTSILVYTCKSLSRAHTQM